MRIEQTVVAGGISAGRWLIIVIVLAGLLLCVSPEIRAEETLRPGVDGNDCKGCHRIVDVLPAGHPDTGGMSYPDCIDCHIQKKVSLHRQLPLGHIHLLSKIGCGDCHSDPKAPAPLKNNDCFNCHGSAREVAERTAESQPNPHDSIHYGTSLDCELCHHQHRSSENFCDQCHKSELKVP